MVARGIAKRPHWGERGRESLLFVAFVAGELFLEVEDSGIGIAHELHGRIFDPFFTTHLPGEGVGLGLSVSRKTARETGGDLLCCKVQEGALFRLTLPLHKE